MKSVYELSKEQVIVCAKIGQNHHSNLVKAIAVAELSEVK